jgi:hypothetical protein
MQKVRPGRDNIAQLVAAVSAKITQPTLPQNQLVLSSKLKEVKKTAKTKTKALRCFMPR